MSVSEKLTAIANEIRTLSGTTEAKGLDAMATDLQAANAAVTAIGTAIAGKGVTVPDGTSIGGMAALINDIPSGGGADNTVYVGSVEPTADIGQDGDIYIMRSVTA